MISEKTIEKINGKEIKEFTIIRDNTKVKIINFGGTITEFSYDGVDVVLGYDTVEEYLNSKTYFGGTIGRVANRIAYGKFSLNGIEYRLALNDGNNSLHGGNCGFNKKVFDYAIDDDRLILSYLSKDGEENYPGNLFLKVTFYLNENGLNIEYNAKSDADTVCNLTNHSYFNLNGHGNGDILNHKLLIASDYILPINDNYVPMGATMSVANTPFDFNGFRFIGERISEKNEQLKIGGGYDHAFALNGDGFRKIAKLIGDKTDIKLDVYTDQKSVQFYSGNFLDNEKGKGGKVYKYRSAVCLETQGYPNAINCRNYPSMVLKKGNSYVSKTIYKLYK